MTTLLSAYKSDGTYLGRCDARCYDATTPYCTCICRGALHGVGLNIARRVLAATHLANLDPQHDDVTYQIEATDPDPHTHTTFPDHPEHFIRDD